MLFKTRTSPFGGRTRTQALVALRLLRSSYPRELSRLLGVQINGVRQALGSLERDGLVVGQLVGRTRVYEINPRFFARKELEAFLSRLADADPDLRQRTADLRRRPRRAGKPL